MLNSIPQKTAKNMTNNLVNLWLADRLKLQTDVYFARRYQLSNAWFAPGEIRSLEIGPGGGLFTLAMLQKGNYCTSVEILDDGVRRLKDRVERNGFTERFEVIQSHVNDLTFDSVFDQVVALEVLEHIMDDEKAISVIAKALKPRGRLILSTPIASEGWLPGDTISTIENGDHVRAGYEGPELDELLRRHGLITVKRKYCCYAGNRLLLSASRYLQQPFRAMLNLGVRPALSLLDVPIGSPYTQITLAIRV
jgi:SAM-dependent methyltransferase